MALAGGRDGVWVTAGASDTRQTAGGGQAQIRLMVGMRVLLQVLAIVFSLQEERALVAPHVIEHVGREMAGDGHQGDEMALVRWFAVGNPLVDGVVGHLVAQVVGHINCGIAGVGRALFGDVGGLVNGGARDVLGGGQAQEAGQMLAIRKTLDVTDLADEGQGVAEARAGGLLEQLGFRRCLISS